MLWRPDACERRILAGACAKWSGRACRSRTSPLGAGATPEQSSSRGRGAASQPTVGRILQNRAYARFANEGGTPGRGGRVAPEAVIGHRRVSGRSEVWGKIARGKSQLKSGVSR